MMKNAYEENKEHDLIEEVKCNLCGYQVKKDKFGYVEDHLCINKTWGYGQPSDGETHLFRLCYACYINLLEKFVIPPRIMSGFHEMEQV